MYRICDAMRTIGGPRLILHDRAAGAVRWSTACVGSRTADTLSAALSARGGSCALRWDAQRGAYAHARVPTRMSRPYARGEP